MSRFTLSCSPLLTATAKLRLSASSSLRSSPSSRVCSRSYSSTLDGRSSRRQGSWTRRLGSASHQTERSAVTASNWATSPRTSKITGAIVPDPPNAWQRASPLHIVDSYYEIKPGCEDQVPRVYGLDYVDSDIAFYNFHSSELGMRFCTSYEKCVKENEKAFDEFTRKRVASAREDKREEDRLPSTPPILVHLYFPPILSTKDMDFRNMEIAQDFYNNRYPIRKQMEEILGIRETEFLSTMARVVSFIHNLTPVQLETFFSVYVYIFGCDDLLERLSVVKDNNQEVLRAFDANVGRILYGRESEQPRIDYEKVPNFPKYLIEHAMMEEDMFKHMTSNIRKHFDPEVYHWFTRSHRHYIKGNALEPIFLEKANTGRLADLTLEEAIDMRSQQMSACHCTSLHYDAREAKYSWVEDGLFGLHELVACVGSDPMTYFRESVTNKRLNHVASANLMYWRMQVEGLDENQAFVKHINLHNYLFHQFTSILPSVSPRNRSRYLKAAGWNIIFRDHELFGNRDKPDTRYAWFPVRRAD